MSQPTAPIPDSTLSTRSPCSCNCGPCRLGWRDLVMGTIEGASTGGAVVTMVALKSLLAGGLGLGIVALEVVVHCLWRRDATVADLHRTTGQLLGTATLIAGNVKRQEEAVQRLDTVVGALPQQRQQLEGSIAKLVGENEKLKETVGGLNQTVGQLEQEKRELGATVEGLQKKLEQMQGALKVFKAQLEVHASQNQQLKDNVQDVSHEVDALGTLKEGLRVDVAAFDATFDEDVSDLNRLIQHVQSTSEEIFQVLAKEISRLQEEVTHFKQAASQIEGNTQAMARLIEQLESEKKELIAQFTNLHQAQTGRDQMPMAHMINSLQEMLKAQQTALQHLGGVHGRPSS